MFHSIVLFFVVLRSRRCSGNVVECIVMTHNWKAVLTSHCAKSAKPLVVVLGPTASGKTAFSLKIANHIHTHAAEVHEPPLHGRRMAEIINADSRQLYRGMDIGTAKISRQEMSGIPHFLLDVLNPNEEVTAAWYKGEASRIIDDILQRGNVPVLVGGSMLYISALIDGLEFVAASDPFLRQELEDQYDADEGVTLYEQLMEHDPATALAFSKNNKPYVIRAMEILRATGLKPSEAKSKGTCPWDVLIFGMQWPRGELAARITARTRQMLGAGWVEEVRSLLDCGYTIDDLGMKSHGYREIAEAILSQEEIDTDRLTEVIAAKSRQYAKRQMTWWRADPRITWLDAAEVLSLR